MTTTNTNTESQEIAQAITLMIIDESGSMMSLKAATEESHNGMIVKIQNESIEQPNLHQYLNTFTFGGHSVVENQFLHRVIPKQAIEPLNLIPSGSTPLFDAIGKACTQLESALTNLEFNPETTMVSVAVFTDGEENSSNQFSQSEIKRLVTRLKTKGWSFHYYGTDISVEEMRERLAFNGGMMMNKSASGFKDGMNSYVNESRVSKLNWFESLKKK